MILGPNGAPLGDVVTLDDRQTVALMAEELDACPDPLILGPLLPLEALQLAGLMQLTLRHPSLSESHRAIAAAVVETIRAYFGGSPTILHVLDRGDDPTQDVSR